MAYNTTHNAVLKAKVRSNQAVVDLFTDMYTLAPKQPSLLCVIRYMFTAYSYDIKYILLGQTPYPDALVPYMGSAYSQASGTHNTVTTNIITKYFRNDSDTDRSVASMIRNNWVLLSHGYLFLNSSYSREECNDDIKVLEV